MRDKKALRELLALDRETLEMMSPKPFKPRTLDVIVSMHAPQLYSEENLAEIKKFSELQQEHFPHAVPRKARNKRVTGKRCRQSEDMIEEETVNPVSKKPRKTNVSKNATPSSSSSPSKKECSQSEGTAEEEVVNPANKKPRKTNTSKNATPSSSSSPSTKRCSQSEDMVKKEVINPVNKKPRKTKISKNATPSSSSSRSLDAPSSSNPSPPELPEGFKNRIRVLNGTDIKFLMHKTLSNTDVEPNNNRLSMPLTKIECDFLTQAEKASLDQREGKKRLIGLEVTVLDPRLREFTLLLKKWDMKTTSTYNLVFSWNSIVSSNQLRRDHQLHIWSFRVQNKIYIILNKV